MLISRTAGLLKSIKLINNINLNKLQIRNGHHATWNYRKGSPPASRTHYLVAEIFQGFMWWWILWHLWTQYDHITGEFDFPDPSKWTDEELGIPPAET